MPDRGLAALYNALNTPLSSHLDDEVLALIVDAELAGENIEQIYQEQLTHIEICERCATNYSELVLAMHGIFEDMAEAAESSDRITLIWNQALTVLSEYINNNLRLTFSAPTLQISEPKPAYIANAERLLTRQVLAGRPLINLEARLIRRSPLTCRLIIKLRNKDGNPLAGVQIIIRYGEVEISAETDSDGTTTFENLPIASLLDLEILINREE